MANNPFGLTLLSMLKPYKGYCQENEIYANTIFVTILLVHICYFVICLLLLGRIIFVLFQIENTFCFSSKVFEQG